jgi:ABC-type transport system involved in multi-copper enzyme maturation permease subunit
MIWLTWRQLRIQAVTAAAALAAFAILLAVTGPHLTSLYAADGLTSCQGSADCEHLASNFLTQLYAAGTYWVLYLLGVVIILLAPAIIGIFWGAPLIARELETGTFSLAWTQSITRTRWLAVKFTLTGLAAMAVTEGLSLMQAWWAAPIGRAVGHGGSGTYLAMGRFSSLVFATHGITPLGYAAFAFTLGVTTGALVRRAIPAMAVTLAIFAAVQVAMPLWIRPHLFPPRHALVSVTSLQSISLQQGGLNGSRFTLGAQSLPGQPGAWIISSGAVNATGQAVGTTPAACATQSVENSPNFFPCLASYGIREAITYQPASRYWAFQWTETGIFLALALALGGFCFWRLGRRLY